MKCWWSLDVTGLVSSYILEEGRPGWWHTDASLWARWLSWWITVIRRAGKQGTRQAHPDTEVTGPSHSPNIKWFVRCTCPITVLLEARQCQPAGPYSFITSGPGSDWWQRSLGPIWPWPQTQLPDKTTTASTSTSLCATAGQKFVKAKKKQML